MQEFWHPELRRVLTDIDAQLAQINEKLGVLMSEDAAVAAAAQDLQADAAALTTAVTALQGLVTALQAVSQRQEAGRQSRRRPQWR